MLDEEKPETVEEAQDEARELHEGVVNPVTTGEGNQPEDLGYAPPDTGQGEGAESEIPVGVDSLDADPAAAESSGDDDGAFDASTAMGGGDGPDATAPAADEVPADDAGDDEAEASADDAGEAAEASADDAGAVDMPMGGLADDEDDAAEEPAADADDTPTGEAEDAPADDSEPEPEPEPVAAEAPADDAGEAEAPAEEADVPAASFEEDDDDGEEKVGDPEKFGGGGDITVGGSGTQSGLDPGEAQQAGEVPVQFRTGPGVPAGLDPGTLEDRDKQV